MNVLTKYTLRSLRKNRVRTLVTIIGILLSVALFTAVAEGAYSGQQYLVRVAEAAAGAYHGYYRALSDSELQALSDEKEVERVETLTGVGWADIAQEEESFPYLRISAASEHLGDLAPLHLLEGRMPENDRELLISNRLENTTGVSWSVGDTVTLQVGRRTLNGEPVSENEPLAEGETLSDLQEAVYTVVGVYERFPSALEAYSMPGSLALTVGQGSDGVTALFTLQKLGKIHDFMAAHRYGNGGDVNRDLLLVSGASGNRGLVNVIYGLVAILFGLIAFGSIALIYNSFSISVSGRTKQFGLLKSIGASNRQILRSVLTEALLLCAVAIPLGLLVGVAGIGLTLRLLKGQFDLLLGSSLGGEAVTMKLVLSPAALLTAAAVGLATTLLSAWIPARRAMRIEPIRAIRQSADLRVSRREVKVSRLTEKLFGVPGMLASKNFKRNRKQYRSTVISLFLSIVLFVTASSLASYLRQDVAASANEFSSDLIVQTLSPADTEGDRISDEALLQQLCQLDGITEGSRAVIVTRRTELPTASVTELAAKYFLAKTDVCENYFTYFYVPQADYEALCRQAGFDPASGAAVAYSTFHTYESKGDGFVYVTGELLRRDSFPVQATMVQLRVLPGYYVDRYESDADGNPVSVLFRREDNAEETLSLSMEEAELRTGITLGGVLDQRPLTAGQDDASLYLPESALERSEDVDEIWQSAFFFRAPNHAAAKTAVEARLKELGLRADVLDTRAGRETNQAILLILDVFTFGFIALISLIAAANVFNTISTNISLRRREFAMLKSVGMDQKGFGRMMRFECLLYGCKALLWGLPVSLGLTWLIYRAVSEAFDSAFRPPWAAMGIAAASVFLMVGISMLYSTGKLRKENIVETLRNDNI